MTLREFFTDHPRAALGFSGGVDSSFLLWAAMSCGAEVKAYYVSTAFQPAFEREDAMRLAASLGIVPEVIELDILSCREVTANPPDRCYHCKKRIFGAVAQRAMEDGYTVLIDGTNASDDASDRPGMRALQELRVLSPLRMCGLTKEEIRRRRTEEAETALHALGFSDFRIRHRGDHAMIEVTSSQTQLLRENDRQITQILRKLGYKDVLVSLEPRKPSL